MFAVEDEENERLPKMPPLLQSKEEQEETEKEMEKRHKSHYLIAAGDVDTSLMVVVVMAFEAKMSFYRYLLLF